MSRPVLDSTDGGTLVEADWLWRQLAVQASSLPLIRGDISAGGPLSVCNRSTLKVSHTIVHIPSAFVIIQCATDMVDSLLLANIIAPFRSRQTPCL